jgi:hypothetical protein
MKYELPSLVLESEGMSLILSRFYMSPANLGELYIGAERLVYRDGLPHLCLGLLDLHARLGVVGLLVELVEQSVQASLVLSRVVFLPLLFVTCSELFLVLSLIREAEADLNYYI